MRVLVVEDEKKTASFIRKALQAEGFAADVCHRGDDALAGLGQFLLHLPVLLALVAQAAHQAAAAARDLHGIQGKLLVFRHLDGDGVKLSQEAHAAEGTAAAPESADDLGLVARSNLPQLDPCFETPGEPAYQLPEINPLLGAKQEGSAIALDIVVR